MCRVTTWACDDGHGEDTYFEFDSRKEADAHAAKYEDGPEDTCVFRMVATNEWDIPF